MHSSQNEGGLFTPMSILKTQKVSYENAPEIYLTFGQKPCRTRSPPKEESGKRWRVTKKVGDLVMSSRTGDVTTHVPDQGTMNPERKTRDRTPFHRPLFMAP